MYTKNLFTNLSAEDNSAFLRVGYSNGTKIEGCVNNFSDFKDFITSAIIDAEVEYSKMCKIPLHQTIKREMYFSRKRMFFICCLDKRGLSLPIFKNDCSGFGFDNGIETGKILSMIYELWKCVCKTVDYIDNVEYVLSEIGELV